MYVFNFFAAAFVFFGAVADCTFPLSVEGQTWTLERQHVLGDAIDPDDAFSQIVALSEGPDRVLYVAQWGLAEVWMFDRNGRRVGTLGRAGDGPGEFVQPIRLGWAQDELWVGDLATATIHRYSEHGDFHSLVRFSLPHPQTAGSITPMLLLADHSVVAEPSVRGSLITDGAVREVPVYRTRGDGTMIGTLGIRSVANEDVAIDLGSGLSGQALNPFSRAGMVAVHPRGTVIALVQPMEDGYSINWLDIGTGNAWSWSSPAFAEGSRLELEVPRYRGHLGGAE